MIPSRVLAALGLVLLGACTGGNEERLRELHQRGAQAYREGDFDVALDAFREALEISPDHPGVNFQIAEILYVRKEYDAALEHLGAALEHDPPPPEFLYLNLKQQILVDSDRKADACSVLEEMVELDPAYAEGYLTLCRFYSDLFEVDKVIATAERAIQRDPDPNYPYFASQILFHRGKAHEKRKDLEKAEADFRKAIEICPTHPSPYYALYLILARSDREEEAQEFKKVHDALRPVELKIDEILTVIPDDPSRFPERLRRLVQLHLMLGQYREAERYCNSLLDSQPGTPDGLVWKGIIKKALKDDMTAERYLLQAIEVAPMFVGAYDELALLYATAGDERYRSMEKAWEVVARARQYGGVSPATLADLYRTEGDRDRAITTLRRALARGEGDPRRIKQKLAEIEAASED